MPFLGEVIDPKDSFQGDDFAQEAWESFAKKIWVTCTNLNDVVWKAHLFNYSIILEFGFSSDITLDFKILGLSQQADFFLGSGELTLSELVSDPEVGSRTLRIRKI